MAIPPKVRTKFYALRALALALMAVAAAMFILRPHAFGFGLLAWLAILVGVGIVRQSEVSVRRARGQVTPNESFEGSFAKEAERVGPLVWTLVGASLAACVVSYYLMNLDALHGGNEVWPVYAFFVAVLALILSGGYALMTKFKRFR